MEDTPYGVIQYARIPAPYISVLQNDTDVENDYLEPEIVTQPAHGTLNIYCNGQFSYIPAPNYFGPDSFTYKV